MVIIDDDNNNSDNKPIVKLFVKPMQWFHTFLRLCLCSVKVSGFQCILSVEMMVVVKELKHVAVDSPEGGGKDGIVPYPVSSLRFKTPLDSI